MTDVWWRLKGGLERLSNSRIFLRPCWSWGVFELRLLSLIPEASQPSAGSRDVNLSISLLTLEKLPLTSFLNPTLQIALLEALPRGGSVRGVGPPCPMIPLSLHSQDRSMWRHPSATLHASFLPPEREVTFSGCWDWGKVFSLLSPRATWSLEAGLLSFPVKAHLWVRALACLLGDGLSQALSQGKMFRSPTIS